MAAMPDGKEPVNFAGHAPAGATADNELTFNPDHPQGGDHMATDSERIQFLCKVVLGLASSVRNAPRAWLLHVALIIAFVGQPALAKDVCDAQSTKGDICLCKPLIFILPRHRSEWRRFGSRPIS